MANHVRNIVWVKGDSKKVSEVANFVRSQDQNGNINYFDLNKIVHMPEELGIECSTRVDKAIKYIKATYIESGYRTDEQNKIIEQINSMPELEKEKYIELGRLALNNLELYGYKDWYDWRCAKWNTKWNTWDSEYNKDSNKFQFVTAWSMPGQAMLELSRQFPDVEFELEFADEDIANNCGRVNYLDGKMIDLNIPEVNSVEAYEQSFRLWEELRTYYKLTSDNNYVHKNDE